MAPPSAPAQPADPKIQTPMWQKVAVVIPALAVFGVFLSSAFAMKIAPLNGLLPGDANKDILAAWKKFAALPELQIVLKPLKLDAAKFMIAVASLHIAVACLLVLPSGPWGTRLSGLWVMVSMLGAEFCTMKTGYVPAGLKAMFPKEMKFLGKGPAAHMCTATHAIFFLFGAYLLFGKYKGTLVQMLNGLLASLKKPPEEAKTEEQRGRTSQGSSDKKRDSTPKAMKKAGDPPSPSKVGKK